MAAWRNLLTAAAAVLAAALLAPSAAQALTLHPCSGQKGFGCGTLSVPLDRTGALPGRITLHVAAQSTRVARAKPGLLIALSGGPGQSGVDGASSFAQTLKPLMRTRRLVTLDQRGTGASGALRCPQVQRLDGLDAFTPAAVAACAAKVGERRRAYSTQDTVADLDAIRVAFGAKKVALMGVSYGTFVAEQYARVHPAQTEALVLDSVIGPDGVNPFLLDSYSRLGRILREVCAQQRCRGITGDPVADLAVLVRRLGAGSIAGRVHDARGRARATALSTGEQLFFALIAGDLNPYLQAAFPGAIASAARGDVAPLLRLKDVAAGGATPVADLSAGLNVITGCEDARLPYALGSPIGGRPATAAAALGALDPASYAPWDPQTVLTSSYVDDCLRFPDAGRPPSTAPLPRVPTLLLSGRYDIRTPLENAEQVQAQIPGAQRVTVPGTGHDELDSDVTGCAERALRRFAGGKRVGTPCAGRTNGVAPFPRPPASLADYRAAPGVSGDRGRVLFAALDSAADARVTLLQRLFGGLSLAAGGLRGGSFRADRSIDRVTLRGYAYLRGVRVSGALRPRRGALVGRVTVGAPRGLGGVLDLTTEGASGTLGGRPVRYEPKGARAASGRPDLRLAPRAAALRVLPPGRLAR